VINNPMPLALVGAGLAWMALSTFVGNGRHPSGWNGGSRAGDKLADQAERATERAGNAADEWSENARQTAGAWTDNVKKSAGATVGQARSRWHDARDLASEAVSTTASQMRGAAQTLGNGAAAASEAAADQARRAGRKLGDAASGVRSGMASVGSNLGESGAQLVEFLRERPIVLAGLGVVVGAIFAAAMPATETENRLMGERSDELKESAADAAREQMNKGAAVAEEAWQGAKEQAQRESLPGFEQEKQKSAEGKDGASLVPSPEANVPEPESAGS
jgi:hypothetical protein